MPEHLADVRDPGAALEEVGGEGMAQYVRVHAALDPGGSGTLADDVLDPTGRDASPASVLEDRRIGSGRPSLPDPRSQRIPRWLAHGHHTIPTALRVPHGEIAGRW